jgi:hypothetical protein
MMSWCSPTTVRLAAAMFLLESALLSGEDLP